MAKLKDEQQGKQNNLCVGLVAHVDAGRHREKTGAGRPPQQLS